MQTKHSNRLNCFLSLVLLLTSSACNAMNTDPLATRVSGEAPHSANPILPGYYADPSIVEADGHYYIYVTLDPWGGETLGCWESTDFKNWTYRELNWPTKAACTSSTSKAAMVWAPSVVRGPNGRFHMVVSVGSEVWAGLADHPLGPWHNALGDKPLIPEDFRPGFHMIDAEYFIDDDGSAYLYWGSGWNWVNGRCFAVKLKSDLITFDSEVIDVTPEHYFEAPLMVKHDDRYYLMYSDGKTTEDSYQVHYAVGDTPFGPFKEADNSPILVTDYDKNVRAPGHHTVFEKDGQHYILYHRHNIPFAPMGRQTCIDLLNFTEDGLIAKVVPTHKGPVLVQNRLGSRPPLEATATASSQKDASRSPNRVLDDNYATRWAAAEDAQGAWLQLDLGDIQTITRQEIRPEFAWKPQHFTLQVSADGQQWTTAADFNDTPASGSPILIDQSLSARYLKLVFPEKMKGSDISLFEWNVFTQ